MFDVYREGRKGGEGSGADESLSSLSSNGSHALARTTARANTKMTSGGAKLVGAGPRGGRRSRPRYAAEGEGENEGERLQKVVTKLEYKQRIE